MVFLKQLITVGLTLGIKARFSNQGNPTPGEFTLSKSIVPPYSKKKIHYTRFFWWLNQFWLDYCDDYFLI